MEFELKKGNDGKFGVSELEKMIIFTGDFEDYIAKVFKDKKVKLLEALKLYFEGKEGISHIVKNADDIRNEFLDLSAEEKMYLSPIIAKAYECPEEEVEEITHRLVIPMWAIIANSASVVEYMKERRNKRA